MYGVIRKRNRKRIQKRIFKFNEQLIKFINMDKYSYFKNLSFSIDSNFKSFAAM